MMKNWLMDNEAWEAWMADKPVLQRLYEERVFSLGFLENGNLGVTENCDGYFGDELTLADLSQLIAELTSVQAEMVAKAREDALREAAAVAEKNAAKAERQGRGDFIAHQIDASGILALIPTAEEQEQ